MVQSAHMVQLTNISTLDDPELYNYGKMRDLCHQFSHIFVGGNVYGIIGECGSGGWGLSYALCSKGSIFKGEVRINTSLADKKLLKHLGYYVGEGIPRSGLLNVCQGSVKKQILAGLKENKETNLQQVCELFGLTPSRITRKIEFTGNERWNASMAIGYAHSKMIYCFPWLNTVWINNLYYRIEQCVNVLKESGAIVILPTANAESIKNIVDEMVPISHPDEHRRHGN